MKVRKVVSAGNIPAPTMEDDGKMCAGEVDSEAEAKTASLLGGHHPLSAPNRHSADEVAKGEAFSQETVLPPKKEPEEVSWTWKRQPLQGLAPDIKLSYRKKVFDDIRFVLTAVGGEKLLQRFCDGCFGHMMHFIGGTSCNKALHELISHEISLTGARQDELWFHISGTNIRFAPPEYALVTGLRFGSFSFASLGRLELPRDGVYKRLFRGQPISVKELWERFNLQDMSGSAEDYLKMAHILALYLMGLGCDRRKTVEQQAWVLVEDLDSWNGFPWGAYTYRELMRYASILPRTRARLGPMYNFGGPVWALQIWAYEAIPQLGNTCALLTGPVTIPRCLKWSFPKVSSIDFAHFFEQELVCSVTLDPTDEEQLQLYWLSVQTSQPLGVGSAPLQRLIATASRAKVAVSSEDTSLVTESLSAQPVYPVKVRKTHGSIPTPSPCLKRTQASLLSSGNKRVPGIYDEAVFVDRVSSKVVDSLTEQLVPQMKQWIEDLFLRQMKKTKRKRKRASSSDDEGCESSSGEERSRGMKKRCRKRKPKYSESSPSESDRYRRKGHKRCRSSSSEGPDSDGGGRRSHRCHRRRPPQQHHYRSLSLPE